MLPVPLSARAVQDVEFNADGVLWKVKIYQAINHMCADILRDGVAVVNGVRCFGGIELLQYAYMMAGGVGNFVFDSDADWENFGDSCNLYYLSQDELADFKAQVLAVAT